MAYKIVLQPTTESAYSNRFALGVDNTALNVTVTGLQDDETAVLQKLDPIANEFVDVLINGATPTFSATNNTINIYDDMDIYRVSKGATIAEVGVSVTASIPTLQTIIGA